MTQVGVWWTRTPPGAGRGQRRALGERLLRRTVAELTGRPGALFVLDRTCRHCGGPHGKPRLRGSGVDASLAYAGGPPGSAGLVAVAAVVSDRHRVGLDVEEPPEAIRLDDVVGAALTPAEARRLPAGPHLRRLAVTRSWVRKEAVLKVTEHGLAVGPTAIGVDGCGRVLWDEEVAGTPAGIDPIVVRDIDLGRPGGVVPRRLAAAVAIAGTGRARIVLHGPVPRGWIR